MGARTTPARHLSNNGSNAVCFRTMTALGPARLNRSHSVDSWQSIPWWFCRRPVVGLGKSRHFK